jgi:hypothetical protein
MGHSENNVFKNPRDYIYAQFILFQLIFLLGAGKKRRVKGVIYPTTLRFGDNSTNKFQRAMLLKLGSHYLQHF